jgi:uncharacterized membrane protein YkvA (DUF1232 family)
MNNFRAALSKIDKAFVLQSAAKITRADIRKVLKKMGEILRKIYHAEPLKQFMEDVRLMFSLLKDYYDGTYREIPLGTICAVTFALLYVLLPLDLIPDAIPIIGYLDDALVIYICLQLIKEDLERYRQWKKKQEGGVKSVPD